MIACTLKHQNIFLQPQNVLLQGNWEKAIQANPHESIEIHKPISLCTLDIIMKCALSYDDNVQASESVYYTVYSLYS